MPPDLASKIDRDGFAIVPSVLSREEAGRLAEAMEGDPRHAIRNLPEESAEIASLSRSPAVLGLVRSLLGPDCFAVRGLLFDKTSAANWKVAWHQDTTIAVREKVEVDGFGPWSVKSGIPHVRPPSAVLEGMVTIRIHLDPCGPDNGPLRVLPGSHLLGRLDPAAIPGIRAASEGIACLADAGDALLMRPLLLHASSSAATPRHRRVVHLEYASGELPGGLQWHGRW